MRSLFVGPYSPHTVRRAAALALLFQWIIVVSGATVRLTGSGLGCPNWPTCTTTRATPALSFHPMIEWTNRMMATPTLLTALVSCWLCWRFAAGRRADLRVASTAVVVGILLEAVVGALVVLLKLPPEIVSVHFLLSIAIIPFAVYAWHASGVSARPVRIRGAAGTPRVLAAAAMFATLLIVIVAGVLTTASGPHSGGAGTGQSVDRFGIFGLAVTLHARMAFAFVVLVAVLTWARARRLAALRDLALLLALVVLQITLGEIQYRHGLPWQVVLAHVACAAALWIVAARIALDAVWPVDVATPVSSRTASLPQEPAGGTLPA